MKIPIFFPALERELVSRLRSELLKLARGERCKPWVARLVLSVEEVTPWRVVEAIAHSRMRACRDPETLEPERMYYVFQAALASLEGDRSRVS